VKTLRLRNNKKLDVKWLVLIPMYSSAALAGLSLAALFHSEDWDPFDWQALVVSLGLLVLVVWLIIAPLLIVQQLLERAEEEKDG
jgi:hypothetical protein